MRQPKYLICRNDMAQNNAIFVLHTQKPKFLAEIVNQSPFELALVDDFGEGIAKEELERQFSFAIKRLRAYRL